MLKQSNNDLERALHNKSDRQGHITQWKDVISVKRVLGFCVAPAMLALFVWLAILACTKQINQTKRHLESQQSVVIDAKPMALAEQSTYIIQAMHQYNASHHIYRCIITESWPIYPDLSAAENASLLLIGTRDTIYSNNLHRSDCFKRYQAERLNRINASKAETSTFIAVFVCFVGLLFVLCWIGSCVDDFSHSASSWSGS